MTIDARNIIKFLLLEGACFGGLENLLTEINKLYHLPSYMSFSEFKSLLHSIKVNNYHWLIKKILNKKGLNIKYYNFAAEFLLSNGMSEKFVNELLDYKGILSGPFPEYLRTLRERLEKEYGDELHVLALMFFPGKFYDGGDYILETILPDIEIFEFFKQKYQIVPID